MIASRHGWSRRFSPPSIHVAPVARGTRPNAGARFDRPRPRGRRRPRARGLRVPVAAAEAGAGVAVVEREGGGAPPDGRLRDGVVVETGCSSGRAAPPGGAFDRWHPRRCPRAPGALRGGVPGTPDGCRRCATKRHRLAGRRAAVDARPRTEGDPHDRLAAGAAQSRPSVDARGRWAPRRREPGPRGIGWTRLTTGGQTTRGRMGGRSLRPGARAVDDCESAIRANLGLGGRPSSLMGGPRA